MLLLSLLTFMLIVWLGMYLLTRDAAGELLRWTGGALLLYGLGFALLIYQASRWLPWLVAITFLLFVADVILAHRGVIKVGEAFWPDFLRALDGALIFVLIFSLPIFLTIWLATGPTPAMRILLLVTITSAIATQLYALPLQNWLDQVAFPGQVALQQRRAELRETADALPKTDEAFDLLAMPEADFVRITRRALSHMTDLPRLSASPLTHLPVIHARLVAAQQPDDTLTRAAMLKEVLTEAIQRLKPPGDLAFDSSDGWRHYNALHFPYVVGLRPYSRRATHDDLDVAGQQALVWLQSQVPERTLYNWQNAAAQLVAQHLRELQG
ncbi:MAG: hypothetical protein R3C14_04065 [Caldilineaceae bacterium]